MDQRCIICSRCMNHSLYTCILYNTKETNASIKPRKDSNSQPAVVVRRARLVGTGFLWAVCSVVARGATPMDTRGDDMRPLSERAAALARCGDGPGRTRRAGQKRRDAWAENKAAEAGCSTWNTCRGSGRPVRVALHQYPARSTSCCAMIPPADEAEEAWRAYYLLYSVYTNSTHRRDIMRFLV
jgi:hypothetical protein